MFYLPSVEGLFLVGGWTQGKPTTLCFSILVSLDYNPSSGVFQLISSAFEPMNMNMQHGRGCVLHFVYNLTTRVSDVGVGVLDDLAYVVGGWSNQSEPLDVNCFALFNALMT